ncbi:hypothetical protein A3Q56_00725 [Intoshia linei]|uniref:Asparagine synthetase [glutamine-hydrolyzing] n=1 Tax=Intoshia linei TaxID=1819745 RepID=A0A177BBE1_9BILA|nr:hypothetical protein A3Q56_00725 [Intoshia linei]
MCGIFFYKGRKYSMKTLEKYFKRLYHRGPENTYYEQFCDGLITLGFHRLTIVGLDQFSMQPFFKSYNGSENEITNESQSGKFAKKGHRYGSMVNGEIYNYKDLQKRYNLEITSNCDCDIILEMFFKFGIEKTVSHLDGTFSLVIADLTSSEYIVARDPIGIKPMYYYVEDDNHFFVSEMKAIPEDLENVMMFPVGSYYTSSSGKFFSYFDVKDGFEKSHIDPFWINKYNQDSPAPFDYTIDTLDADIDKNCLKIAKNVRKLFLGAVRKRLMSDRPIGCILSGGLDSTLITALVKKVYDQPLHTYTVGLKGSEDLHYAKIASEHIGTDHHELLITPEEYVDAIDETIYQIESYDVTTVRASIGNYLVSQFVKKIGKNIVIYCGDVSDEIFGGYRGFGKTECGDKLDQENVKMLNNIQYFDVLRSDKTISSATLDARVPFADKNLLLYVMSIPGEYKRFDQKMEATYRLKFDKGDAAWSKEKYKLMEKQILRNAFSDILPEELLWRRKEAFSDGIAKKEYSAFNYIKDFVESRYSDDEFLEKCQKYKHCTPYDKESLYYREIFEKHYPNRSQIIPFFWRHPFSDNVDPSARLLDNY